MDNSQADKKSISLLDITSILLSSRRILGMSLLISLLIGIGVAFLLPKWYYSYGSVKSSTPQRSGLGSLLSSGPIEQVIGGFTDLGFATGFSDLQTFIKILESRRVLSSVIDSFDLMKEYDVRYIDDAMDELKSNTNFKPDIESNVLFIGVYDKNPIRVAQIASYFIELLNKVNIELSTTRARNTREFVEKRYFENLEELKNTEDSLRDFQKQYGVVLLEEQTKTAIQVAARLKAELTLKEVQMGVLRNQLNPTHPDIQRLRDEIRNLQRKFAELYVSNNKNGQTKKEPRIFVPFADAPDIGLNYLRLYRDVKIKEKLAEILLPLYEKAKIEEKQDTPTLLILDTPFIPEKKSKPFRLLIVLSFMAICLFISLLYILIVERIRLMQTHRPEEYLRVHQLASEMRNKLIPQRWFKHMRKN